LLRSIASGLGRTRALVTSRFKLTDLEQWEGAGYRTHQLDELDKQSAVSVLQAWGVNGTEGELSVLAEKVGHHALSVSVLGSYLHHFCGGNPKGAEELKMEEISADEPYAGKLQRILAGYARDLPDAERDLLVRLSVFPRGVSMEVLVYIVDAGGEIAGMLIGANQAKLLMLAERLQKMGLVFRYEHQHNITYTAHPFLREYFRNLLGVPPEQIHEVVRTRLSVGLDTKPDKKPRESEILDRYETLIEHSILAGCMLEAYDLYVNIFGGSPPEPHHLYHTLGDYGRMIRILSRFTEDGEPEHLAPKLLTRTRSFLINVWGLAAHALGDLVLAKRCFDVSFELFRNSDDRGSLSQIVQNRAWVAMYRGAFPLANKLLKESLDSVKPDNKYVRKGSHSYLAWTCHALGEITEAQLQFTKAKEVYDVPYSSLLGIYETDHLLALGEVKSAYECIVSDLSECERYEWPRTEALCHALLGLICLPDSLDEARGHLKTVRDWTVWSGHMECIIRAHILAVEIARYAGDLPGALAEATTGLNLAKGCGYGKFTIDLLLLLAKIQIAIPEYRPALGYAREALDRSQHPDCRYAWGEADALYLCGICHQGLSELELARQRLESALKIRERIKHPGVKETRKLLEGLKGK